MRRRLNPLLCTAIILSLLVPAVAVARPGHGAMNKGKAFSATAGEHGKGAKARGLASAEETPVVDAKAADKAERKAAKAAAKAEKRAAKQLRKAEASRNASESAETSPVASSGKLTGIANALSHIQANLARKQAAVAAGLKAHLPAGLLSVVQKFMSWLGIGAGSGEIPGSGSTETSGTVPPSDNTSGTIPPSGDASGSVPPSGETSPAPLF